LETEKLKFRGGMDIEPYRFCGTIVIMEEEIMASRRTKATSQRATKPRRDQENFYQYLPGAYIDSYEMFPADDDAERSEDSAIRRRMLLQLAALIGLLVAQLVLFGVLVQSTTNLG
jgi:hypothetical protein